MHVDQYTSLLLNDADDLPSIIAGDRPPSEDRHAVAPVAFLINIDEHFCLLRVPTDAIVNAHGLENGNRLTRQITLIETEQVRVIHTDLVEHILTGRENIVAHLQGMGSID